MKIQQFIKRLNKIDTQQSNAKDRYLRIAPKALPDVMFPDMNGIQISFYDRYTETIKFLKFNIENNDERRIKLAGYFKRDDVLPGDEILVERREDGSSTNYYIDLNIKNNTLVFEKKDLCFECINWKRFQNLLNSGSYVNKIAINGEVKELEIIEISEKRVSIPSRKTTQGYEYRYYKIIIDKKDVFEDYADKSLIEIILNAKENSFHLASNYEWQKYEYSI